MLLDFGTWKKINEAGDLGLDAFKKWMEENKKTDPKTAIAEFTKKLTDQAATLPVAPVAPVATTPTATAPILNTTNDKSFDYKKEGDKYYYKPKSKTGTASTAADTDWVVADAGKLTAIKTKINFEPFGK